MCQQLFCRVFAVHLVSWCFWSSASTCPSESPPPVPDVAPLRCAPSPLAPLARPAVGRVPGVGRHPADAPRLQRAGFVAVQPRPKRLRLSATPESLIRRRRRTATPRLQFSCLVVETLLSKSFVADVDYVVLLMQTFELHFMPFVYSAF